MQKVYRRHDQYRAIVYMSRSTCIHSIMAKAKLMKDAKAAFQGKQFKDADTLCHEILNIDEHHAPAYLLLGAIYQEHDTAKAASYLYKAAEYSKDPTLAYQGLLKCAPNEDIPNVAQEYLKYAPSKYDEIHKKLRLCALSVRTTNACIAILQTEVAESNNDKRVLSAYQSLVHIYMELMNVDKMWLQLFRESFEFVISDRTIREHAKMFSKYLKILKYLKDSAALLAGSIDMLALYPDEYVPLDMMCWLYVERFKDPDASYENFAPNSIDMYADKILEKNDVSVNALTAKGIYLYQTENYVSARDYLNRANSIATCFVLCLRVLGDTHMKLRAFTLAEYCYKASGTNTHNAIKCLVEQNKVDKWEEAFKTINRYLPSASDNEKDLLAEPLIKTLIQLQERHESVEENLAKLATDSEQYVNLRAFKLLHSGEYEQCAALLEANPFETCDYYLHLGRCMFHLNRLTDALNASLRATKLEPFNADCFHWLGKIYHANGDLERACKCFEKSVYLNPQHEQSVILLSTIYRQQREWEQNARILQNAAQAIPNVSCKWAELQLGLHYLAQNQYDEAIGTFRAVLRTEPKNFTSWEGLADAYTKRGSFSSALKVYQKICELNESNVYAQLQVATIKTTLRMYTEAIESYDGLLAKHPNYLPALKGMADAHWGTANQFLEQRLVGRSRHHAAEAVTHLIRAISIRNNVICLWRSLANCFDFVASLPVSKAALEVPSALIGENSEQSVRLEGDKLFELAARFYCRAIKLNSSDISLWYELSLNYYNRAMKYGTPETAKKYLDLAAESAKYIVRKAPHKWKHWNLLGVICTTRPVRNLSLSQHAFIRALKIDRKLAVVWTNLGVLYLQQGQVTMAKTAFAQAQQSQPSYAQAWSGQAQIAEIIDPDQAIDLLQHSTSLCYHDEAAIQYAYWVCRLLNEATERKAVPYYVEHMHVIASALDSVTWYCNANESRIPDAALSFQGYLNHAERNWRTAIAAYTKATEQTSDPLNRDKMLCNLGFSLLNANKDADAVQTFSNVSTATFRSTIGLAQSFFKVKQYESSYSVYGNALELLANSAKEKSMIFVALSSMIYAFQGENDAKTVLLQLCTDENSADTPIEALISACALGILHNDLDLSELVLNELQKYEREALWCHHVAFLTAELHLKRGEKAKAIRHLYSQVHQYPDKPLLRKVLAQFLLKNGTKDEKHSMAAYRMVDGAIVMQRAHSERKMCSMDTAKLLVLASEAMRCVDVTKSKKLIQRAIHVNPLCKEAWIAKNLLCT